MYILFLSHYFPPEVNAPASRTYDHVKRWAREPDIKVTVITNHPNHPKGILYPGYRNRWRTREEKEGIDVCRVKTYLAPNKGFVRRTLNYFFFMVASVIAALRLPKPDVVVATSPQFFCAVAGYLVSLMKGSPFVFELRDIWPESIVTVGAMRKNLTVRTLEKVELFLYGRSARVIALTDAFKRNLVSRGIPPSKIEVVKNGVDLSFFNPHLASPGLIQELQVNSRFVASYIGTVGMAHAVEKIVEVAERLKGVPEILFLVVGEGANKEKIQNLVSQKELSNIKILPGVSKDRVRDYYAVTDLNLVTLRNTKLFRTVIPSKIFEIMAMGRPILCSVDGECREIVEQAGSGVYVEPENVEQMAQVVQNLSKGNDVLLTMGQNGRRFVEAYFDRDNLAATYLTLLRQVSSVSI